MSLTLLISSENLTTTRDQYTEGEKGTTIYVAHEGRSDHLRRNAGPGSCTKRSAWVDADFATCPDTRRSVSGGAVMLAARSVGSRGCRR